MRLRSKVLSKKFNMSVRNFSMSVGSNFRFFCCRLQESFIDPMFDPSSSSANPKRHKLFSQSVPTAEPESFVVNTSKSKRKDTLDRNQRSIDIGTEVITTQIKKCRINCTPGELRY